jgi:hypothetical protein
MKLSRIIICSVATVAIFMQSPFAVAQSPSNPSGSQVGSQGSDNSSNPNQPGQGGDDTTLEIAPQPGLRMPKPGVEEIPGDKTFRPDDDTSSIEPNFRPRTDNGVDNNGDSNRLRRRPYLGMTVEYTTQCYLGMEEHGLEVVSVDPNSPAAIAGLQSRTGMTALGAAGVTLGTLLGPASMVVNPLLNHAGALGQGGDLIVAVDDRRVRSQGDLEAALTRLKPGDTMYLTIIRPTGNGQHKTMKIAVRLGAAGEPIANAAPSNALPPPSGESETH